MSSLEIKRLTLSEFNKVATGYNEREEDAWDRTRHVMSSIINYGGMGGGKKYYSPQEVLSLSKDKEEAVVHINSDIHAYKLLERFKVENG